MLIFRMIVAWDMQFRHFSLEASHSLNKLHIYFEAVLYVIAKDSCFNQVAILGNILLLNCYHPKIAIEMAFSKSRPFFLYPLIVTGILNYISTYLVLIYYFFKVLRNQTEIHLFESIVILKNIDDNT